MRIIQLLPTLIFGDAVGNDVLVIRKILRENGYSESIFAERFGGKLPKDNIYNVLSWKEPGKDDIILYHMAIASNLSKILKTAECRKIAIYHNITPPDFNEKYDKIVYTACRDGIGEVRALKGTFDYCLADSEFNRRDLLSYGYKCPIDVLPIIVPYDDYKKTPDEEVIAKYKNTPGKNILFVGRVAPNKKHEDIIAAFALYQKYWDENAKLFLVGNYNEDDAYYCRLSDYVRALGVRNVFFPGHIRFEEILAYYSIADVFLCMSEHEGFCVPLVEAMLFEKPIIAYDAAAVPDTLGSGGIVIKEKDPLKTAGLIDRAVKDGDLRAKIIQGQKKQLERFSYESIKDRFLTYLDSFIRGAV